MTENKSLKRRVRSRMAKTGERYTAARRQVVDSFPAKAAPAAPAPTGRPIASQRPADELVVERTGRSWGDWFAILDEAGARDWPHPTIARWLRTEHGVPSWWDQSVTVQYELETGRRVPGQRADGFAASASRTFDVPVERLYAAFVDESERARWLPDAQVDLRGATPGKSVRFEWGDDGSRVVAGFTAKGPGRSHVGLEHQRLTDTESAERLKAHWREALARLKAILEA